MIEKDANRLLEEYRKNSDLIKTSLNTKEEVFKQIDQVSIAEQNAQKEIKEIDAKLLHLKNENKKSQEKLTQLQQNQRDLNCNSLRAIEELQQKIKEADDKITNIKYEHKKLEPKILERPKSVPHLRNKSSKSPLDLTSLKKDLKEIRDFFTVSYF